MNDVSSLAAIRPDIGAQQMMPTVMLAWVQSRVEVFTGDHSWFHQTRNVDLLQYALEECHGLDARRKFGFRSPLIHEIGTADQLANMADLGVSVEEAVFGECAHDCDENRRARAKRLGRPLPRAESTFNDLLNIWGGSKASFALVRDFLEYMNDEEGLQGPDRIRAQYDKSFDANGICIISPFKQAGRMADKDRQVGDDIIERIMGTIPDEALPKLIWKAEAKSFVTRFPLAQRNDGAFARGYRAKVGFLKQELFAANEKRVGQGLQPLPLLTPLGL